MTRILICGDRKWKDVETIENFVKSLPPDTVIIHGDCRGADKIADKAAKEHGLTVEPFSAKWEKYGGAAGPIRNRRMLVEGKPDRVVAFHDDLSKSRGTADMVKQARKRHVPCEVRRSFPGEPA
uniref:YspA cpYpsA-related SLOG domain-containing protein n=1 Tax=viral metagenome TaxID=1070528 RepID=A0A6M3MD92_9ZZZZ